MALKKIRAQQQDPRSFSKELQLISYAGGFLFNETGGLLLGKNQVYYPKDYSKDGSPSVVADPLSYKEVGISSGNKFSKGIPAALPIEEQFPLRSEVSRSLLGVNRAETQQGIFGNVSSYGLDKKDWVAYGFFPDYAQGDNWKSKNSPGGPHRAAVNYDDAANSSIVLTSYAVPYRNPGNRTLRNIELGRNSGNLNVSWARYINSLVAMYIVEHMVNNFTDAEKKRFNVGYIDYAYPKTNEGNFDRLYWDRIWTDIDQSRISDSAVPSLPLGEFRNFGAKEGGLDVDPEDVIKIDITQPPWNSILTDSEFTEVDVYPGRPFFATTRYTWEEPDKGHYRLKTPAIPEIWQEYWGIDYDSLPQDLKDWEFRILESEPGPTTPEYKYKLPYYLITDKTEAYTSLIFGSDWPRTVSDDRIASVLDPLASGNLIGARPSSYAGLFLQSQRAFRYQPGRISGFTYGVRVSEEGAGPGTVLEFGVENFSDGYFFRFKDGTDFSIVRRSTVSLGNTTLFNEARYIEKEAYINKITGIATYSEGKTEDEIDALNERVEDGDLYKIFECEISQRSMNGDPLNSQGESGYIYDPDKVTMYKIEFGWYGAIGARFYAYIPQEVGTARWVTLHTLVIENQINQPCLQDPFFFFKYRIYVDSPSVLKIPQFVEKFGASYYIDGGDEGTVSIESGSAVARFLPEVTESDYPPTTTEFPIYKWGSVFGIKPKREIVNNEGSILPNKKEIFPVSASIYSTRDTEIKFVNQFACREHAYTFQESYRCNVQDSQTYRGLFEINYFERNPGILESLGRAETNPCPTISYAGQVDSTVYPNSWDNLPNINSWGTGGDEGWNRGKGALIGSHIIAEDVYGAYVNPENQFADPAEGASGTNAILLRGARAAGVGRGGVFSGPTREALYRSVPLLYKYKETDSNGETVSKKIATKLSNYRRDTTMISTVPIQSSEFFIFYTSRSGKLYDSVAEAENNPTSVSCASGAPGCDGDHIADYQLGVIFPRDVPTEDPAESGSTFEYPRSLIARSLADVEFGVLNPKKTYAQNHTWTNESVEVVQNAGGDWAVKDKSNPKPDEYLYYEGLPIDIEDPALETNVMILNQTGRAHRGSNGLEVNERFWDFLGEIDQQLPGVPGEDGGSCRAIYFKLEQQDARANVGLISGQELYLIKSSRWPTDLEKEGFTISLYNTSGSFRADVISAGEPQEASAGSNNNVLWKLKVIDAGNVGLNDAESVEVRWNELSAYETSLVTKTANRLNKKVVSARAFPLKVFARFRDGGEIGSIVIGKYTPNGIVQLPFTPHGCTISTGTTSEPDTHGGGSDGSNAAKKHLQLFSEPGVLQSDLNHSIYDVSGTDPQYKPKKCASFISPTTLSGAGFSGVGDYPLRFLKFKDSGDPVGNFFISKNTPTEISLKELFNINAESVGPTFWSNKALFMIARDSNLAGEAGTGKISVTLNYKEQ